MDVSPPPYDRSCSPSLWNFATNLGKSQLMGPRGASLCLTCEQTPRGALFRWDLVWRGTWFCTYSYVISTRSRKSSRRNRRLFIVSWFGNMNLVPWIPGNFSGLDKLPEIKGQGHLVIYQVWINYQRTITWHDHVPLLMFGSSKKYPQFSTW